MSYVITIGRQFGSGGRELGRQLATKLGIPFYDKEILMQAAKNSGISEEFFFNNDEKEPTFLGGIIPFNLGLSPLSWYMSSSISDDNIYRTQCDFIHHIAEQGPCVIVGRSADYVLRDMPNVINVFLHANMDDCVKRIMRRSDCATPEKAKLLAERTNKLRANFYNFYTDKTWGKASSYDLCLNTSLLPIESIVDIIIQYIKYRVGEI